MRKDDGSIRKLCERYDTPGHPHELTFSCHKKLPLLSKDRSRQWFVNALALARKTHDFELWAYVIMPDHAHVLLLPRQDDYSISAILKTIKQSVSRHAIKHLREHAPEWLEKLKVTWPTGRVEHRFWQQGGGLRSQHHQVRNDLEVYFVPSRESCAQGLGAARYGVDLVQCTMLQGAQGRPLGDRQSSCTMT